METFCIGRSGSIYLYIIHVCVMSSDSHLAANSPLFKGGTPEKGGIRIGIAIIFRGELLVVGSVLYGFFGVSVTAPEMGWKITTFCRNSLSRRTLKGSLNGSRLKADVSLLCSEAKCTTDRNELHFWVVVLNIVYFHPYLGKISILTNIFQRGWNHQLDFFVKGFGQILGKQSWWCCIIRSCI